MFNKPTDLTYKAPYKKKISRLFVFRFLWMFIEMWILWVWSFWMGIVMLMDFFYSLFTGKRHKWLWEQKMRYMRHTSKWMSYLYRLTDRRPDFIED